MKTQPVEPARIVFGADGVPRSTDFGDIYHPPIGAAAQAQHVFLAGNGLPARWAGRERFTILELGFGLGNNFVATLRAAHGRRIDYVAVERHPPTRDDMARVHGAGSELVAAWPPLVPGVHLLDFGPVRLLLAFGDVRALLPELRVVADAVFLDGFDPAANPAMWDSRLLKLVGRRVAPGATAATWSVARPVRDGLVSAGFDVDRVSGIGGKRQVTVARWNPRFAVAAPAPRQPHRQREAIVVGAGLAGAWTARALADQGWHVTVLDRHAAPAAETSGNPAGIFHGTVHGDDGPHARLLRAAALLTARLLHPALADGVAGAVCGLLRLDLRGTAAMQALVDAQRLPADWVQVLDAAAASARAGVAIDSAAWFYPAAGWTDPGVLTAWALDCPGVGFVGARHVARIASGSDGVWQAVDADGSVVAAAPVLVLANAGSAAELLRPFGLEWPLRSEHGVLQSFPGSATPLRLPLAGAGYAVQTPDALHLGGSDHPLLQALRPDEGAACVSRSGWRLQMPDKLPLAGPVPLAATIGRSDQPRWWPRHPGLYVVSALGGRGITLAPLLGRLVAAQIAGAPLPLEQSLIDAVDPARTLVRHARRTGRGAGPG